MNDKKGNQLDPELESIWGESLSSIVAEAGRVPLDRSHMRQIIEQSNKLNRKNFTRRFIPVVAATAIVLLMINLQRDQKTSDLSLSSIDEVELELLLYGDSSSNPDFLESEDQFESDLIGEEI